MLNSVPRPGRTQIWQALRDDGSVFKTRIIYFNAITRNWRCIYATHDRSGSSDHPFLGSCFVSPHTRKSRKEIVRAMLRYDSYAYETVKIWEGI